MASSSAPETLPYSLKTLQWDAMHHFNSNNKYSYSGKGRKLSDPMLQCDMCEQWFHLKEVSCVSKDVAFVPFQRNYRFSCRICTAGPEQFELQTNTWTSIVLTAIYNLLLSSDGTTLNAGEWVKVQDVVTWVQEHWGGLTAGRNLAQLIENAAVPKCLLYAQNSQTFTVSDDRSEVLLRHVAPSKLLLKPHVSSAVPGIVPVGKKQPAKSEGACCRRAPLRPSLAPPPPHASSPLTLFATLPRGCLVTHPPLLPRSSPRPPSAPPTLRMPAQLRTRAPRSGGAALPARPAARRPRRRSARPPRRQRRISTRSSCLTSIACCLCQRHRMPRSRRIRPSCSSRARRARRSWGCARIAPA